MSRIARNHFLLEANVSLPPPGRFIPTVRFATVQIRLFAQMISVMRRRGIGVVRAGDPFYLGLVGLGVAHLARVPLVIRVSGNFDRTRQITGRPAMPRLFKSQALERLVEGFVLRRADWVFAPNAENLNFARRAGARQERSSIVRYGGLLAHGFADAPTVESHGELRPAESTSSFVLVVSRLESVKRVDDALRAFAIARAALPEIQLWIAGDGSLRGELEGLAEDLGVADSVHFLGAQSQEWLVRAYQQCRAFLTPQSGRALSEAALCGAPVAGYQSDWQAEIVVSGMSGLLAQDGDWQALGEAIVELVANPERARALGARLQTEARKALDRESNVEDEREIYRTLVGVTSP